MAKDTVKNMVIESTHRTNSAVHVVTLNGIEQDGLSVGTGEETLVRNGQFTVRGQDGTKRKEMRPALYYRATDLVSDVSKELIVPRGASIKTECGPVPIPKSGLFITRVDDCYSVEVNGKRRYVGNGAGSFSLIEESGAE